ncbi:MAG: putative acetyltransferase [Parachlamydiales bacterium]|nr:putative acetyltransferase [Parachlamydiales bacterium]
MTLPSDYDIRYSVTEDLAILQQWLADPVERRFFPFETDQETEDVLKNWIGFSRYKAALTGMVSGQPCAMGTLLLMPYRKVAHHASFYVFVEPGHRRLGIGTSMVRNLLHLAKTRFSLESVSVEIYEPNPIIFLLEKIGFEMFARQENFIKIDGSGHARICLEHFFT